MVRLSWLRWGALPRNDQHAGILANMEPWQQNSSLMLMTRVHSSSPRLLRDCSHLHRSAITDFCAKTRVVNGEVTLTPNSLPHWAQDVPTHRSFCESGHSRAPKPLLSLAASQRTRSPLGPRERNKTLSKSIAVTVSRSQYFGVHLAAAAPGALVALDAASAVASADDVARGQGRYHCAQNPSSISLGQQFQGVGFWAHRGNQATKQCRRQRPAQASNLANASRQDIWFFIVLHMKSVMSTRLLERTNLK